MAEERVSYLAFNRGVVSPRGLGRIDLDRLAVSAERMRNFVPRVLGSMMLRPGLEYIDNTDSDRVARNISFIFEVDDTAVIELTTVSMRVRINDTLISRPSVSTSITNENFTAGALGWSDVSDTGGTVTYTSSGYVDLSGDETDFGRIEQQVTVSGADQNTEHALYVDVEWHGVLFKVGSTSGDDDYISETRLGPGVHSLSFTPTGNFFIQIASEREFLCRLNECSVESSGAMELATPWSDLDLPFLRWDQSGDVVYVACKNGDTTGLARNAEVVKRIERRGDGRSWSIVTYEPQDGPFLVQNTSGITLTPSAINGDITLAASKPLFKSTLHVNNGFGALFRIASNGQTVTKDISSADDWTDTIRVIGNGNARVFQIVLSGTWVGTAKLQFAFSESGPWNDTDQSWTANIDTTYDDGQEDSVIYYRLGIDTGDYTSGTLTATLVYANGSIQGVCQLKTIASSTSATARVLKSFGGTAASKDWWEGAWSYRRGYPTATVIDEGRLWWAGADSLWGSVSDDFESFDDEVEGDSGPVLRSIGHGPIKTIHWLLSMARLLIGTSDTSTNVAAQRLDGNSPLSVRSSNFDEPITPTNFNIKPASSRGVFVDRSGQRLYELAYDIDVQDYKSIDLSIFAPDYNSVGIKQIAVQMKPDIRIHCVRNDGTVGILIYDRLENVICWCDVDSSAASGEIEDVAVLPGTEEDEVYYIVKRTINGGTERHICKWAKESEAIGGTTNKMADSFVHYNGAATTTITGLDHLEGETVSVWADGAEVDDATVSGGQITIASASEVIVGLKYTAQWKAAKLASVDGIGLFEKKKVNLLGIIAENLHHQGLQYGPDFSNLHDLPAVENSQVTADDTVYASYHEPYFAFGGEWEPDSRICLQSQSPRPATLLAIVAEMESVAR